MERSLVFPCTWKLLCVHKSNKSLKYNHVFICLANTTLGLDVTELGRSCAVADQIQLAPWWWTWKQYSLTASQVYKYVFKGISPRVTPSTLPCGVLIAPIVTSLLLYINICTAELLGCAADIKPQWEGRWVDRSDLRGWIWCLTYCRQVSQCICCMLLNP